jgi:hypothetical protein
VTVPQFRIAWLMVAVAIAAFDFAALRAFLDRRTNGLEADMASILLLGALPMWNVLAVGMLVGQRRPGSRPFLMGFEAFGAMALVFFIVLASCFPREIVSSYLKPVFNLILRIIGEDRPFVFATVLISAQVMLAGPQVAFALAGGFISFSRRFKITITITPR